MTDTKKYARDEKGDKLVSEITGALTKLYKDCDLTALSVYFTDIMQDAVSGIEGTYNPEYVNKVVFISSSLLNAHASLFSLIKEYNNLTTSK